MGRAHAPVRTPALSLTYRAVRWILQRLGVERIEIGDHVSTGDLYLTRWILRKRAGRKLMLHCFHRGDYALALHDHPWRFTSLVLWPGYFEHAATHVDDTGFGCEVRWRGPLSLATYPATHRHRVELDGGRWAWTLVLTGPKERDWGFWCPTGWRHWIAFDRRQHGNGDGCGA